MSKQDELFTEELARRNPDWEKIVAAHNDALAAEREQGVKALMERSFELHECQQQLATAVEALKRCRQGFIAWNDPQHTNLIDAALERICKVSKLNEN